MAFITASLFSITHAISSTTFYTPERSDLLMALFLFLSMWFFIRYRQKNKSMLHVLSIISFALSLLCKEMAMMLPLLLALEIYRNPKEEKAPFKPLFPYLAILLVYALLRVTMLNFAKGTNSIIDLSFPATLPLCVAY